MTLSRKQDISSVGQLQSGTIGLPGLPGLWILGKKYTTGVLGVVVNRLEAEAGKSPAWMKWLIVVIYFLFLYDEGPMLETLEYTIHIGSTPTFLHFDLYLYSAYAAHYVYKYFDVELPANVRFHGHEHQWVQSILPDCGPQSVRFNYLQLWKSSLGRCRCQRDSWSDFNNSWQIWEVCRLLKQRAVEISQGRLSFFFDSIALARIALIIFQERMNCISFSRASAD